MYWWLFKSEHKAAPDNRIRTLLDPSHAATIGVSGDTPAALAGLRGILLYDGFISAPDLPRKPSSVVSCRPVTA